MKKFFFSAGILLLSLLILFTGCAPDPSENLPSTEPPKENIDSEKYSIRGQITLPEGVTGDFTDAAIYSDVKKLDADISDDGKFVIKGLDQAKTYTLFFNVTANGAKYSTIVREAAPTTENGAEVTVALSPAWTIKGKAKLKHFEEYSGHSGILVKVEGMPYKTVTDKDGSYVLEGIPSGFDYRLSYSKSGLDTVYSMTFNLSDSISPSSRSIEFGEVYLVSSKCSISGKITSYDGTDISKYRVSVVLQDEESPLYPVNVDGTYKIENLLSGTYDIKFYIPGYEIPDVVKDVDLTAGENEVVDYPEVTEPVIRLVSRIENGRVPLSVSGTSIFVNVGEEYDYVFKEDTGYYEDMLLMAARSSSNIEAKQQLLKKLNDREKRLVVPAVRGTAAYLSSLLSVIDIDACKNPYIKDLFEIMKSYTDIYKPLRDVDYMVMDRWAIITLQNVVSKIINLGGTLNSDGRIVINVTGQDDEVIKIAEEGFNLISTSFDLLCKLDVETLYNALTNFEALDKAVYPDGDTERSAILFPSSTFDKEYALTVYNTFGMALNNVMLTQTVMESCGLTKAFLQLYYSLLSGRDWNYDDIYYFEFYWVEGFMYEFDRACKQVLSNPNAMAILDRFNFDTEKFKTYSGWEIFKAVYNSTWANKPEGPYYVLLPASFFKSCTDFIAINEKLNNKADPDTKALFNLISDQSGNKSLALYIDTLIKINEIQGLPFGPYFENLKVQLKLAGK